MVHSSDDMLALVAEINIRKIPMVLQNRAKRLGGMLGLTEKHVRMVSTARKLHHRFTIGTYRHELEEVDELETLGQWLIEEHAANEGTPVTSVWHITRRNMISAKPVANGRYQEYVEKILAGQLG